MNKRILLSVLLMAILFAGCYKDDIDELQGNVDNITNRLEALEQWMNETNTNIASLQTIVTALEKNDYITSIVALADSAGYEINFSQSGKITIYNGKNGADGYTPEISIEKDKDGNYCWTLDSEFITNAEGKNISAMGLMPQLKIEADYWHISYDGKIWTKLGKAKGEDGADGEDGANGWGGTGAPGKDGDSFFYNVDYTTNPSVVTFILADKETTFTVPRVYLTVGFESNDVFVLTSTNKSVKIVLPEELKEEDFKALMAEIKVEDENTAIVTKTTGTPNLTITEPTFTDSKYNNNAAVTFADAFINNNKGEKILLKVTLIDKNGQEISATCVIIVHATLDDVVGDNTANNEKIFFVTTAEDLISISDKTNQEQASLQNITIQLVNDIDLTNKTWTPINAWDGKLNGVTIDGGGYTISNMSVNESDACGFISENTSSVTIKNLTFDNAMVKAKDGNGTYAGVVIGKNYSSITLENVHVTNSKVMNNWQCGGLIGFAEGNGPTFKNCSISDSFVGGSNATAGSFFGLGTVDITLTNCHATNVKLYTDGLSWNSTQKAVGNYYVGHLYGKTLTATDCTETNVIVVSEYPK